MADQRWLHALRHRDHTQGSLTTSLLALSVPAILTSIGAFGLFQMLDLALLGRLGPDSVAAAGATNQTLRQIVFLFLMGLSTSTQMWVARRIGARDTEAAEHVAGQAFLVGAVLWVVCIAVGVFAARPLVALVTRDPAVVELGTAYIQVVFPFLGAAIVTQIGTAVLNGAGDATTPMLASFVVTPIALAAEWAFGFGNWGAPNWGIAGLAFGAGIGGASGAAVLLAALFRSGSRVRLRAQHLAPDGAALRELLGFAWQPALHMVARSSIVFLFMILAGRIGGEVQAAYTIGFRIESLAIMIAFPISNAAATLVGQNLGAGSLERAKRSIRVAWAVEMAFMLPIALAIFVLREPLVGFFTDDAVVAALAVEYLAYACAVLTFYGIYFVAFRALQAAGDMRSPMRISVTVALLIGAPLGFWLTTYSDLGATGMWIANLVYAVVNTVWMVAQLLRGRWTEGHTESHRS